MVSDIDLECLGCITSTTLDCSACIMGKMTRQSFRKNKIKSLGSSRPLGLIHADLIGPISIQTPQKETYILSVVDDFTGYTWTILLKSKADATEEFIHLLTRISVEQDRRIDTIRYDNGTEIVNYTFRKYCRTKGIKLHAVPRYTPQFNGVIERKNRSIIQLARTLLLGSSLPRTYWGYAVRYVTMLLNSFVSNGNNCSKTVQLSPYELWTGIPPDYLQFHPWRSPVYY